MGNTLSFYRQFIGTLWPWFFTSILVDSACRVNLRPTPCMIQPGSPRSRTSFIINH